MVGFFVLFGFLVVFVLSGIEGNWFKRLLGVLLYSFLIGLITWFSEVALSCFVIYLLAFIFFSTILKIAREEVPLTLR